MSEQSEREHPGAGRPPQYAEEIAREFREKPLGQHSPELQRVLTLFRSEEMAGKYVLVCTEPHRRWALGQLSGRRGEPVTVFEDIQFTSREDAEWEVFRRRWERYFGEELNP